MGFRKAKGWRLKKKKDNPCVHLEGLEYRTCDFQGTENQAGDKKIMEVGAAQDSKQQGEKAGCPVIFIVMSHLD